MRRITGVVAAGVGAGSTVDTVILDLDQRRAQRGVLVGTTGARYELDLDKPIMLRMGDMLVLDDGGHIEVVAEAEPLIEVRAKDLDALARVAWHLGDRHVPVEIFANRLRLRPDAAIETLLAALGARIVAIEAPFNPEGGAYRADQPGTHRHHHHGHGHPHDHDH